MSLTFPSLSDATREHLAELIRSRAVTDRARRFLHLAVAAVESTPPAGLRAHWYGNAILLSVKQERIAELLDCSMKTVQRATMPATKNESAGEFAEFVHCERLTVRNKTGSPVQRLVYAILIDRLETLPAVDVDDRYVVAAMQ